MVSNPQTQQAPPRPKRLTIHQRAACLDTASGVALLQANTTALLWRALATLFFLIAAGLWGWNWYTTAALFSSVEQLSSSPEQVRWLNTAMPAGPRQPVKTYAHFLTLQSTSKFRSRDWMTQLKQRVWQGVWPGLTFVNLDFKLNAQTPGQKLWQDHALKNLKTVRSFRQVEQTTSWAQWVSGAWLLALLPALVATGDVTHWEKRQLERQRAAWRQ